MKLYPSDGRNGVGVAVTVAEGIVSRNTTAKTAVSNVTRGEPERRVVRPVAQLASEATKKHARDRYRGVTAA